MPQTSIDTFFKNRKRPASESISLISLTDTRKIVAQDDRYSGPVKSSVELAVATPTRLPSCLVESSVDQAMVTPNRSAAEQERLRKELDLGQFKKLVRQSKQYTTLKSRLEKHNATVSRLKTIQNSGRLKPRKLFHGDSSRSSDENQTRELPQKLSDEGPSSPIRRTSKRYQHLLGDCKNLLVLPPKFTILKNIFDAVEIVVRILMDRKELVTFRRIQNDVQKLTRRNFTEQHMGMIKTIYPDAYKLKYEFVKLPFSCDETLELVIEKSASYCADFSERKKVFERLLLEHTKFYHQEFLKTLDPPVIVPNDKILRWHPLFNLDEVPDITPAHIPRPAIIKSAPVSVKDFLEKVKPTTPGVEKIQSKNKTMSPVTNPIPALQKALKGVPKSLLEKIRAKKAVKMAEGILPTSEEAKKQVILSRLPELAKILRMVFVNEKKGVLREDLVLTKVSHSFKEKLSTVELIKHLKLISECVPGWLNFFSLHNISYIRLSKDADLSRVVGRLQKLAQPI